MGFPGGSVVENLPANAGDARDMGSSPGSGRSLGEGNGNPTPVFLPGKSHGQRSLVGYSLWGHKELDMTEHAHTKTAQQTAAKRGGRLIVRWTQTKKALNHIHFPRQSRACSY